LPPEERAALIKVPGCEGLAGHERFDDHVRDTLLSVLYRSPSHLTLISLEDALGGRGRVNLPGSVADTNWSYRMPTTVSALAADGATSGRLLELARASGRK
jgi:4-alpha-glucanotransferase